MPVTFTVHPTPAHSASEGSVHLTGVRSGNLIDDWMKMKSKIFAKCHGAFRLNMVKRPLRRIFIYCAKYQPDKIFIYFANLQCSKMYAFPCVHHRPCKRNAYQCITISTLLRWKYHFPARPPMYSPARVVCEPSRPGLSNLSTLISCFELFRDAIGQQPA